MHWVDVRTTVTRDDAQRIRPSLPPRDKTIPGHAGEPTGPQQPFRRAQGLHTADRPVWPYVLIAMCIPLLAFVVFLALHLWGADSSSYAVPSPTPGPDSMLSEEPSVVCPTVYGLQ